MSPLEKLGLEVVAGRLLQHRGQAVLLCALLDGVTQKHELLKHKGSRYECPTDGFASLRERVSRLRDSMDDVGMDRGAVVTIRNHGYAIAPEKRGAIINRLIEEANA